MLIANLHYHRRQHHDAVAKPLLPLLLLSLCPPLRPNPYSTPSLFLCFLLLLAIVRHRKPNHRCQFPLSRARSSLTSTQVSPSSSPDTPQSLPHLSVSLISMVGYLNNSLSTSPRRFRNPHSSHRHMLSYEILFVILGNISEAKHERR